jgi:hypothetical protein
VQSRDSSLRSGLDLVVAEEHADLERDRVERLRPDDLAALGDEFVAGAVMPARIANGGTAAR